MNCAPGKKELTDGECWAVTDFPKWKVSQYGSVRGAD